MEGETAVAKGQPGKFRQDSQDLQEGKGARSEVGRGILTQESLEAQKER